MVVITGGNSRIAIATHAALRGEIMRRLGSLVLIIVPIVAHGRFYGILTVSVVERPERLRSTPALNSSLAGVVAQAAISLDNARLIESMAHQARHDSLTGLLGHRAFHEALENGLRGENGDRVFTLAIIDIDDFKLVNDLHGHPAGDEALRHVAETLRRCVRDQDLVFRVGGEEFAVLATARAARGAAPAHLVSYKPSLEPLADYLIGSQCGYLLRIYSLPVAERLRSAVARTPFALPLRVSIGLASWPDDAEDRDGLLERADDALYAAKHAGKDRTSLATTGPPGDGSATPRPQRSNF